MPRSRCFRVELQDEFDSTRVVTFRLNNEPEQTEDLTEDETGEEMYCCFESAADASLFKSTVKRYYREVLNDERDELSADEVRSVREAETSFSASLNISDTRINVKPEGQSILVMFLEIYGREQLSRSALDSSRAGGADERTGLTPNK